MDDVVALAILGAFVAGMANVTGGRGAVERAVVRFSLDGLLARLSIGSLWWGGAW